MRRCIPIFFLLIAGLLCTLATAWPIALSLLYLGKEQHRYTRTDPWNTLRGTLCSVEISRQIFSDAVSITPLRSNSALVPDTVAASTPYWAASPDDPHKDPHSSVERVDTGASGWPFRALASESWMLISTQASRRSPAESIAHGIVITVTSRGRIFMPLRPIWPGLIADVSLYAGSIYLLARCARAIRSKSRIRRGICSGCAYDLRGTSNPACPECGKLRSSDSAPANNAA